MSRGDYKRMDLLSFGEALLATQDLDPVYVVLHGAGLPEGHLHRWLVAYWCFYHAGAASYLSTFRDDEFWRMMIHAAQNETSPPVKPGERWPRASERRYFRGPKCVKAVEYMWNIWEHPEDLVAHLISVSAEPGQPRTERGVIRAVKELPLFGPWIGFKVADMMERVLRVPVEFSRDIGLFYEEPRKGLELFASQCVIQRTLPEHYEHVMALFTGDLAPPGHDRYCNVQEVETILCKWKSHMGGHYPVGKDVREVGHALEGWGDVAYHLSKMLPTEMEMDE